MKKCLIITIIATSLLIPSLGRVVFADAPDAPISGNHISTTTTVTNLPNNGGTITTTVYNMRVTNYTSKSTSSKNDLTSTLDATFLHDKNSAEMTTILNLRGFIPSNLTYKASTLLWPYKYIVKASNLTPTVDIAESFPKNTIETTDVSSTVSYSLGGGLEVSAKEDGPSATGSSSYNLAYSKSISYTQSEYNTVQRKNTNNSVQWDVTFDQTRDGYTINSYNPVYGNQMFMIGRYNSSNDNITHENQLSSLMSGGFSPNMGMVLTAPMGTKKSTVKVSLGRESMLYDLQWYTTHWGGEVINKDNAKDYNLKYVPHWQENQDFTFEIDWQHNTVKSID